MAAFTALNGNEPKAPETQSGSPSVKTVEVDGQSGVAATGHERRTSPPSQREQWAEPALERPVYHTTNYPEADSSHKRKRSDSVEPRRQSQGLSDERASLIHQQAEPREVYATPQRDRDYRPYGDGGRDEAWYSPREREERASNNQQPLGPVRSPSEEQSGDHLQDTQGNMDSQQGYSPTSPDDDAYYGGSFPSDRRDGAVQSDPKKRKRNFSNRTKTGCLTCRKRKKKCDELKPECNNCLRGGFICQGYPNQRGYQKMENKPSAVPLESKDPSYIPPGAYGMPQPAPYGNQPQPPPKRDPPPPYRGQPTLRIEPPQNRVLTDDDRQTASTIPTASVTSPDNKLSAISVYTGAANMFPTPISAISKEYQRIPPLHDSSRAEPETPHPGSALPQINILNPTRTSSPQTQPPAPPTSNAQTAAQLALSHGHFSHANRSTTQKELMLRGEKYMPFDKELVLERERCSAACWRFNNSTNPNNGVSGTERARLFREILVPKELINLSPVQQSPVSNVGRVGNECVVEAPFTCDYGYNITIGHNVFIGRNCTILDPCSIKIGNNVYIGPNVSIYGATLNIDPRQRQGSKSLQTGKPIVIEDDVFIGGGSIILPGLRIGKGSTVAAGSVVTKTVVPFLVVAGNPAHTLRGVGPGS